MSTPAVSRGAATLDPVARRLLAVLRAMSPAEAEAWFRYGQRLLADTPAVEAEAATSAELGTPSAPQRVKG